MIKVRTNLMLWFIQIFLKTKQNLHQTDCYTKQFKLLLKSGKGNPQFVWGYSSTAKGRIYHPISMNYSEPEDQLK